MVGGAIRTDFILSAEIMVISLNEVADEGFWSRAIILVVVAFGITALVYGVVALIVKMDDVGLNLAANPPASKLGEGLVEGHADRHEGAVDGRHRGDAVGRWPHPAGRHRRPRLARIYDFVHHWEVLAAEAAGGFVGWLVNTLGLGDPRPRRRRDRRGDHAPDPAEEEGRGALTSPSRAAAVCNLAIRRALVCIYAETALLIASCRLRRSPAAMPAPLSTRQGDLTHPTPPGAGLLDS